MERLLTKGFSMQITLELSPDVEVRLRESVADGDVEAVRRLLEEALTPTVEALLRETPAELTDTEFEVVADQLARELTASLGSNVPSLSDYAVSRAGIYEDHP
jgi:antitoxin ParD1/3/4